MGRGGRGCVHLKGSRSFRLFFFSFWVSMRLCVFVGNVWPTFVVVVTVVVLLCVFILLLGCALKFELSHVGD